MKAVMAVAKLISAEQYFDSHSRTGVVGVEDRIFSTDPPASISPKRSFDPVNRY
jgi:hypothetical protein